MFARKALALACLVLLVPNLGGCFCCSNDWAIKAEQARRERWLGHPTQELIRAFGAPQQVVDDGRGGKAWIYRKTTSYVTPARTESTYDPRTRRTTTTTTPGRVQRTTREDIYFVGPNGLIYDLSSHTK